MGEAETERFDPVEALSQLPKRERTPQAQQIRLRQLRKQLIWEAQNADDSEVSEALDRAIMFVLRGEDQIARRSF